MASFYHMDLKLVENFCVNLRHYTDGLCKSGVNNSIANEMELSQSCAKPGINIYSKLKLCFTRHENRRYTCQNEAICRWRKTVVTPLLTHWSYHSLAHNHRYISQRPTAISLSISRPALPYLPSNLKYKSYRIPNLKCFLSLRILLKPAVHSIMKM